MIREQTKESKVVDIKSVRVWRRGMGKMADRLGVSRTHLWYVVNGIRRSPRIERDKDFKAWKKAVQ